MRKGTTKSGDWELLKIDKETKPISNVLYQIIPPDAHSMKLNKSVQVRFLSKGAHCSKSRDIDLFMTFFPNPKSRVLVHEMANRFWFDFIWRVVMGPWEFSNIFMVRVLLVRPKKILLWLGFPRDPRKFSLGVWKVHWKPYLKWCYYMIHIIWIYILEVSFLYILKSVHFKMIKISPRLDINSACHSSTDTFQP